MLKLKINEIFNKKRKLRKMKIKYAIFDLDGTLLNTIESLIKTVNAMLNDLGYASREKSEYQQFVGYGAKNLVKSLLIASGDEKAQQLEEAYQIYMKYFEDYCVYNVEPYPGILELLKNMKEKNIQLAVLTNKPHQVTGKVLDTSFDKDTFAFIQGQNSDFPRKPDPTAALHIAKILGAENTREVIFMGDSDADMQTAKNANMVSVGASWGFRNKEELIANGCEILLEKPLDLIPYLS